MPVDFIHARTLTPEVSEAVEEAFEYQAWSAEKIEMGRAIRAILAQSVKVIIANAPPCQARTDAIHKIQEARMNANAAITFGRY